ncbi:MAG TPA: hypothetical protein VNY84_06970, partial [Acidimicrobiales bacterium]|nr:hypothetical protein [Acidimicrobiales bacterium]
MTAPARHPRVAYASAPARGSGGDPLILFVAATAGLMVLAPALAIAAAHNLQVETHSPLATRVAAHAPAFGHVAAHLSLKSAHPTGRLSSTWYTQQGMTIARVNASSTIAGVPWVTESFVLSRTPYSTGFELNGLTASGDWIQVVVADNWPGCPGWQEVTEVWDSSQNSGAVNCDSTVTLAAGDLVQLELNFTASRDVCLVMKDLSTEGSRVTCQAQPNAGSAAYELLSTQSNGNGYYTGPMTEVVNLTAGACPDYTLMPQVGFEFPRVLGVTSYIPWSDEFALGGSVCYVSSDSSVSLSPGDLTSHYIDTAYGSSYGPRWAAGQNTSALSVSGGFRYQTDVVPLTYISLTASTTDPAVGQTVVLTASGAGGAPPYGAVWVLNGSVLPSPRTLSWGWAAPGGGSYDFASYVTDANLDVYGPSTHVVITVQGALSVGPLYATPSSGGVDVGQNASFVAQASGGVGSRSYTWSGLPTGCFSADTAILRCEPLGSGAFSISVTVRDSNGSKVSSTVLPYAVMSDPTATLRTTTTVMDAGQSFILTTVVAGGAGSNRFAWTGLPTDCSAPSSGALNCQSFVAGNFFPAVSVTDRNGYSVRSATTLTIHGDPTISASASRTLLDAGQVVSLAAVVVAGTPGFHFAWSHLPVGCSSNDSPSLACVPTGVGTSFVSVTVTDAVGIVASSATIVLAVAKSPTVTLSSVPGVFSVGA